MTIYKKIFFQKINYFSDPLAWNRRLGASIAGRFAEEFSRITEYMDLAELQRMRWPRLKRLLSHAYQNVPAYREHYARHRVKISELLSEKDLFRLPPMTRGDFKKYALQNVSTVAQNIHASRGIAGVTSGSTAEPLQFFIDRLSIIEKTALRYRYWRRMGADPLAPKIFCAPASARLIMPNLIFFHPHFIQSKKREYIDIIRASRSRLLYGFPLTVFDLLWMLDSEGVTDIKFDTAVLAGHTVAPGLRAYFQKRFQCDVLEYYGTGEVGSVAAECELHNGLHINEENMIVEIVDHNGQPLPAGSIGKVLLTYLGNEVMPFIRYDIGDYGVILPEQCICGRTLRQMLVDGRSSEYLLQGLHGESISPSVLRDVLDSFFYYFHRYQVIQTELDSFILNIIPTQHYRAEMDKKIINMLKQSIGNSNIRVKRVQDIPPLPSGKFQYFISELWKNKFPEKLLAIMPLEKRFQKSVLWNRS